MHSSEAPFRRAAEPRCLSVLSVQRVHQFLPHLLSVSSVQPVRQSVHAFVRFAVWFVLALASPAQAQPLPGATTLERVVAVVDGRPLLLSDVADLSRVRGLAEAAALEAAIDERLMYAEASRLAQAEVQPADEDAALGALLTRQPALASRVAGPELRRLLRRQLTILKYVEFRFRPQLRVSDQEVRAAFEADPAAGESWEAEKQKIRERLERRALDERIEAWVKELRGRADVRYVGREPASGGP